MSARVGFFTASGYDYISSPVVNSAAYLAQKGYAVDIFGFSSDKFDPPNFGQSGVRYYPINRPAHRPVMARQTRILLQMSRHLDRGGYQFLVGFDPLGLIYAGFWGRWHRIPYVYHSLEIASLDASASRRRRLSKAVESWLNKTALLTITQDEQRADVLSHENHIDRDKVVVVYNSAFGPPLHEKKSWLRERLNIPRDKRIVLAVGSLIREHWVDGIAESSLSWPEQYVLVLHGWFPDRELEEHVRGLSARHPHKVYLSTKLLPPVEKFDVFQSADLGLVFFRPINDNLRYTGAAAGKLFDFARCGVPVIANDLPGMRAIVERNEAGIVVPSCLHIGHSAAMILRNYERFRQGAVRTYQKYEFSRSYDGFLDRLRTLLGTSQLQPVRGKAVDDS